MCQKRLSGTRSRFCSPDASATRPSRPCPAPGWVAPITIRWYRVSLTERSTNTSNPVFRSSSLRKRWPRQQQHKWQQRERQGEPRVEVLQLDRWAQSETWHLAHAFPAPTIEESPETTHDSKAVGSLDRAETMGEGCVCSREQLQRPKVEKNRALNVGVPARLNLVPFHEASTKCRVTETTPKHFCHRLAFAPEAWQWNGEP